MKQIIPNTFASEAGKKDFKDRPESGVMSQVNMSTNKNFWQNLSNLIGCRDNEEITGVVIEQDGWMKIKINHI